MIDRREQLDPELGGTDRLLKVGPGLPLLRIVSTKEGDAPDRFESLRIDRPLRSRPPVRTGASSVSYLGKAPGSRGYSNHEARLRLLRSS